MHQLPGAQGAPYENPPRADGQRDNLAGNALIEQGKEVFPVAFRAVFNRR